MPECGLCGVVEYQRVLWLIWLALALLLVANKTVLKLDNFYHECVVGVYF